MSPPSAEPAAREVPAPVEPQLVYNKRQAARLLGISRSRIEYLVADGELPAYRLGRLVVFRHEDLAAFVAALPPAHGEPA